MFRGLTVEQMMDTVEKKVKTTKMAAQQKKFKGDARGILRN